MLPQRIRGTLPLVLSLPLVLCHMTNEFKDACFELGPVKMADAALWATKQIVVFY